MSRTTLHHLPVELLYEIQLWALSKHLPHTSMHLHEAFKFAPTVVRAQYLLGAIGSSDATSFLTKALRYPICTADVLDAICRLHHFSPHGGSRPDLPKRLFRALLPRTSARASVAGARWTDNDAPVPLIRALFTHPSLPGPNPNSHDGYPLTRAVFAAHIPLVRLLLDQGADPASKNGAAVTVAIRRFDLALVRMLIERDFVHPDLVASRATKSSGKKRKKSTAAQESGEQGGTVERRSSSKRRKLEDRMKPTTEMLKVAVRHGAWDIVEYLRTEKACVPDLQTLYMMRGEEKLKDWDPA